METPPSGDASVGRCLRGGDVLVHGCLDVFAYLSPSTELAANVEFVTSGGTPRRCEMPPGDASVVAKLVTPFHAKYFVFYFLY